MWKASFIAAGLESVLVAVIMLYAMVMAHAGSGVIFLAFPLVWTAATFRLRFVLGVASAIAPSRSGFFTIGVALGALSGIAVGSILGERSFNLALIAAALTIATAVGCALATDEIET